MMAPRLSQLLFGGALLCCIAALCVTPAVPAAPLDVPPTDQAAGPSPPPREIEVLSVQNADTGRFIQLPEDGDVWYTSVFVHDDWQRRKVDRELVAMFDSDQSLRSLKSQTKFKIYTASDPFYRDRFSKHCPVIPAVMVQRGNGEVVFHESAQSLEPLPVLPAALTQKIEGWRCDGRRCYPTPTPAPDTQPDQRPRPRFDPPVVDWVSRRDFEPIPNLPRGFLLDFVGVVSSYKTWGVIAVILAIVGFAVYRREPIAAPRVVRRKRPAAAKRKTRR